MREKTEENITEKHIAEKHITGSVSRGTSNNRYIREAKMESRAFHVKHSCGQTMKVENEVIRR